MTWRLRLTLIGVLVLLAVSDAGLGRSAAAGDGSSAVSRTETITRAHLVDGADQVVDTRTVTVKVAETRNLRDRQAVTVSWTGAHPTGGLVNDHNSAAAALQEYPVVVMQCRGVDSPDAPPAQQVSPRTCWTQTPAERFAYSQSGSSFPAYRMDRYAVAADRAMVVGQPDPLPTGCADVPAAHWIPFLAADGTTYYGGNLGCAGLPPEAANSADSLQPGSTTYGVADGKGNGSTKFIMQAAEANASLGCSATVVCTLEVIPIMGVSCDPAGTAPAPGGMPAADRPPQASVTAVLQDCAAPAHFVPGAFNGGGEDPTPAVSGSLWWTASNWRNRIAVPLTFAPTSSVCDIVSNKATVYLYGAESMVQATQQWAPTFCLNSKLFNLRHVQTSEPQAKNLLAVGNVEAALQGAPPTTPFASPVVQAPTALTGFAIAYSIDGADGTPYPNLRLDARLLAKLLSESYRSCALDCLDFTSKDSRKSGFAALARNPIDISRDPEFQALNPGIPPTTYLQSAATLAVMSSDSDVMTALTSYINADPEAREWLDGRQDPWGMVVNPAYEHITLPVANWPLLDAHIAHLAVGANLCLTASPAPWLPLVAAPVSDPSVVALDLQFDIANSQTTCQNNGSQNQKLTAVGRQAPGIRFLLGLVSLADAQRYQLNTAELQTQNTNTDLGMFDDASGRSFAGPTDASLKSAAGLLAPDDTVGTWTLPYDTLRTDARGKAAYAGTMLISTDVPTKGLPGADAVRYGQFLRFVAGAGQTPGLGNGQLPPGYLPLTAANGLGALARYTEAAAAAVESQCGQVPSVSGRPVQACGHSTPTTAPRPTTIPAGPSQSPPPAAQNPPPRSNPPAPAHTTAPRGTVTDQVRTVAVAPAGKTTGLSAGFWGLALPGLLVLALLSAGLATWTSGVGRR